MIRAGFPAMQAQRLRECRDTEREPGAHSILRLPSHSPRPRGSRVVARVRILGIDPGSRRTGFGLIECHGADSVHIAHGCIVGSGATLSDRLRQIFEGVRQLVEEHRPDEVAIERVFVNRNVDSALKLGHARGAALCAVPQAMPVFEYAPRAIKLAVVGFGAAEKLQVAHMIRTLLQPAGPRHRGCFRCARRGRLPRELAPPAGADPGRRALRIRNRA